MRNVLMVLLLLPVPKIYGQDLPAILTEEKKRGIYLTYSDFLNNTPLTDVGFSYEEQFSGTGYKLILDDSLSSLVRHKDLFGFCSGDSVFFHSNVYERQEMMSTISSKRRDFSYVREVGRYTFWIDYDLIDVPTGFNKSTTSFNKSSSKMVRTGMLLNLNNGKFYELTGGLLTLILKKDSTLYSEYKSLGLKNPDCVIMFQYLQRYNRTHEHELRKNKEVSDGRQTN